MAERKRTGIAISGVDIASPDHSVTDGKCEQLHNMRYANGAWRNVHPFVERQLSPSSTEVSIERLYGFGRLQPLITDPDDGDWGDGDHDTDNDDAWGDGDHDTDNGYVDDDAWADDRDDGYDMFGASTPIVMPDDTELLFYSNNKKLNVGDTLYKIDKAGAVAKEWGQISNLTPYLGYDVGVSDLNGFNLSYNKVFRVEAYDKKYTLYAWTDEAGSIKFYTTTLDLWDNKNRSVALYEADDQSGAITKYLGILDDVFDNPNKDDEYFNIVVVYKSATTSELTYISDVGHSIHDDINVTKLAYTAELGGDIVYTDSDGLKIGAPLYRKAYSGVMVIGYINHLTAVDTLYRVVYTIKEIGVESTFDYVFRLKNVYVDTYTNGNSFEIIYKHPVLSSKQYILSGINTIETNFKYSWEDPVGGLWWVTKEDLEVGLHISNKDDIFGTITKIDSFTGDTATIHYKQLNDDTVYRMPLQRAGKHDDIYDTKDRLIVALGELAEDGTISVSQILSDLDPNSEISINHFGKALIVNNHSAKKLSYFLYDGEYYKTIDLDSISCKATTKLITQGQSPDMVAKYVNPDSYLPYYFSGDGVIAYEKICNEERSEWYYKDFDEAKDYWRGEFAIFFALRTANGSIIHKTAPQIVSSIPSTTDDTTPTLRMFRLGIDNNDKNYYAYVAWPGKTDEIPEGASEAQIDSYRRQYSSMYHRFYKAYATLDYNIGESELVTEVAIYATRLYSALNRDISDGVHFVSKVDLLQESFYLMDTVKIDPTKSKGSINYSIGYKKLKNIEQKVLYTPTISAYQLYSEQLFEYNNRLHMLGVTHMMPTISDNIKVGTPGAEALIVAWNRDSYIHHTRYNAKDGDKFSLTQGILITLPEKATTINFVNTSDNKGYYDVVGKLKMSYSPLLDMSYYIGYADSSWRKYQDINTEVIGETILVKPSVINIDQPNRIQASSANNCFEYPYENSYRVGSETSHIIAANSAAVEMSDAKFGEFPLYVFTDEGIFAMQSGGNDALYSAIIPISYDKAIQPNTLAVNYNVLFVTKEGIMALSSQGVRQLSQELDNLNGNLPEWMKTTQLLHLPRFNEIVATDFADKKLYVYSASQQVWSSRDVEPGRLLNNGEIVVDNNAIYNLLSEDDNTTNTEVTILTRPIKLGSMELKRLETFILRFEAPTAQTVKVQLYGSTDTINWIKFREVSVYTNRDIIIRRVPLSAKYLRVEITGAVTDDIRIIAMEMEYYLRMLHRMR